jgi:26S proteasome regulatory subunit N10
MPLESCMILLDNSEFMRNGDYIPTRLEAQSDAANLLVNAKTGSNPESTVGVIAMSSTGPSSGAELLVSPTDDLGKILAALHGVRLSGEMVPPGRDAVDIASSVQVAALALKHRRNKNGSQRIVLFVGSPLNCADNRALVKAGKQLKKNNVSIDVVVLGETEVNEPKLRELVDAANGSTTGGGGDNDASGGGGGGERTCHLVTIPAGVLPSDVLVASPILRGEGGGMGMGGGIGGMGMAGAGSGGGGGGFAEFGGVDPSMDPELAMALRVSMEEERARQERVAAAAAAAAGGGEEARAGDEADGRGVPAADESTDAIALATDNGGEMNDEDALLQQALAMSMAENQASASEDIEMDSAEMDMASGEGDEDDEDAAMQMALAMSMQGEEDEVGSSGQQQQQFQDPAFVNQVLTSFLCFAV